MTPDRTWDPLRFQRGTREFAAFVTALNAFSCWASQWSSHRRPACRTPPWHGSHDDWLMSVPRAWVHDAVMDAMSMVVLAIGSLVFLELAALNLRGEARGPRAARESRPRR